MSLTALSVRSVLSFQSVLSVLSVMSILSVLMTMATAIVMATMMTMLTRKPLTLLWKKDGDHPEDGDYLTRCSRIAASIAQIDNH